jgi:LysM repeat protein
MAITWRTGHLVLTILLVLAAAMAQQQYVNSTDGYTCNGRNSTCNTYGLYRTFQANESLEKVAGYFFNVTPETIANLSGMSTLDTAAPTLPQGQPLYIPLSCICQNGTSQMLVPHVINTGDTFYLLSSTIYGGFTQYQAMEAFNPTLDVRNLSIGVTIRVPIFCACPTTAQLANGTNFLLTYTVYPDEPLDVISGYFGITTAQLSAANELSLDATLGVNTTLLVPLVSLPPIASLKFLQTYESPPVPSSTHGSSQEEKLVSSLGSLLLLC